MFFPSHPAGNRPTLPPRGVLITPQEIKIHTPLCNFINFSLVIYAGAGEPKEVAVWKATGGAVRSGSEPETDGEMSGGPESARPILYSLTP